MRKISRLHTIFVAIMLVLPALLLIFSDVTHALPITEPGWERVKLMICDMGAEANQFNSSYIEECIVGIGKDDAFCENLLGPGITVPDPEKLAACKYGVLKSDINNRDDRVDFVRDHCVQIGQHRLGDDSLAGWIYRCEGDERWFNDQGYCLLFNRTPVNVLCSVDYHPDGDGGNDDEDEEEEEDGEEEEDDEEEEEDPGSSSGGGSSKVTAYGCRDSVNSTISWIYCPQTDIITGFVDLIINNFIIPFLQWRIKF